MHKYKNNSIIPPQQKTGWLKKFAKGMALATLLLLPIPSTAYAASIKIFGLSWNMNENEIKQLLGKSGYECKATKKGMINAETFYCGDFPKGIFYLVDNRVLLPCKIFDICEMSIEEIAQSLVDNKIVSSMNFEPYQESEPYNVREEFNERYCAIGEAGDKLCVRYHPLAIAPVISLIKHRFGKKTSFN